VGELGEEVNQRDVKIYNKSSQTLGKGSKDAAGKKKTEKVNQNEGFFEKTAQ